MANPNDNTTLESQSPNSAGSTAGDNEIRATRDRRRKAERASPLAPQIPRAQAAPLAPPTQRHVPREVRQRFVQVGKTYYFSDGAKAFEDHGRRLSTPSDNTEVVASLLAIARTRGWERVVVSGSDRFRQEAWRQGSMLGIGVRGYQPSDVETARIAQDLAATQSVTAEVAPAPKQRLAFSSKDEAVEVPLEPRPEPADAGTSSPDDRESIVGRLLESGAARYRHDPTGARSYFVRLQTASGERTVWGRDLAPALEKSLSQPKVGDDIVLRRIGREPVSIRFTERKPDGTAVDHEEVRFRNRWSIESAAWIAERSQLADALRRPERGTEHRSPDLVNARLSVRQAELMAAEKIQDPGARVGFTSAVREQLAQRLARGEAVPAPELRERTVDAAPRERGGPAR